MATEVRQLRSDASDNRARILAAALLAFTADGPSVSVREIARRAQVGVATVYRHFPTKQALFAATFAEQRMLCSTIVEEGLAADDPWQGLSSAIEKLVIAHSGDPRAQANLAQLARSAEHAADHDRTVRGLVELIRRARASGALRADIGLEDVVLAIQASRGVRAASRAQQAAASRRLAALVTRSFRAGHDAAPLPPAVRLPLRA